jgi:hypothetical protein
MEQGAEEPAVDGQTEAERPGEGEHSLAVAGFGQELIDQIGTGVGHAATDAARAQPTFAGDSDQLLLATFGAANPRESVAQDSTGQVTAKVALDEARIALAVEPTGLGGEGPEVFADDGVQDASPVRGGSSCSAGARPQRPGGAHSGGRAAGDQEAAGQFPVVPPAGLITLPEPYPAR